MPFSVSWHTLLESDEAEELREEIEELESRIEELTEFKSGSQFHTRAGGEP